MRIKLASILFSLILIYSISLSNIKKNQTITNKQEHIIPHSTEVKKEKTKPSQKQIKEDKIATLKIPKINLIKNLYDINSKENDVNKNIEIIKESNMPDIEKGNLILAAHNGESSTSYFHNLKELNEGDEVIVNYRNIDYKYNIKNKYNVFKTGKVTIKRDKDKNTITMITCSGENEQLVVIGYKV